MNARYFGLVPAAGSGPRSGADVLKHRSPLAGRPMLYRSIQRLLATPEVEIVLVVLPPGDTEFRRYDWRAFGERLAPLYCGGASRRDSVLNGLVAAASAVDSNDWMLVHDAVRPCLGKDELRRLIDEAGRDEVGGILAIPVADTLKRADEEHRIVATEPRDGLWRAQTPQMFRHRMLVPALREAEDVTAQASAGGGPGSQPKPGEGRTRKLKMTFPAGPHIAERIIKD